MLTTDLALRFDPIYEPISRRFLENPDQFADAFARAWYKLTHRDMGPIQRYLGPLVPQETLIWQDPVPGRRPRADRRRRHRRPQGADPRVRPVGRRSWSRRRGRRPRRSAAATSAAAPTAPASGSEPQRGWEVNDPDELAMVLRTLEGIQESFNGAQTGGKQVSLADLIVLGGCAAVEQAAKAAGHDVEVPFTPGRTDASQEQTDVESFAALEPTADGFRNYRGKGHRLPAEYLLVDRANLLTLSAPEMTVLVGGLRVLGANYQQSPLGVLTSNARDADQRLLRQPARHGHDVAADRRGRRDLRGPRPATGEVKWTGSRVDLVFGSNSELRAVAEVYASDDAQAEVRARLRRRVGQGDELDRFDLS